MSIAIALKSIIGVALNNLTCVLTFCFKFINQKVLFLFDCAIKVLFVQRNVCMHLSMTVAFFGVYRF